MTQPIAYLFRGVPTPRVTNTDWGIVTMLSSDKAIPVPWLGLEWRSLTRTPLTPCGPGEFLCGTHHPEAYEAPWPFPEN